MGTFSHHGGQTLSILVATALGLDVPSTYRLVTTFYLLGIQAHFWSTPCVGSGTPRARGVLHNNKTPRWIAVVHRKTTLSDTPKGFRRDTESMLKASPPAPGLARSAR